MVRLKKTRLYLYFIRKQIILILVFINNYNVHFQTDTPFKLRYEYA